jgi:hypothetical protein
MATAKKADLFIGKEVIVTTSFRGVYHGVLLSRDGNECAIGQARMVIRWGTTNGVDELAATGPTSSSKIAAKVESVLLFGLTSVSLVSDEASKSWANR